MKAIGLRVASLCDAGLCAVKIFGRAINGFPDLGEIFRLAFDCPNQIL